MSPLRGVPVRVQALRLSYGAVYQAVLFGLTEKPLSAAKKVTRIGDCDGIAHVADFRRATLPYGVPNRLTPGRYGTLYVT